MNNKVENRILNMYKKKEFDMNFIKIKLKDIVQKNILSYQHLHLYNLISIFSRNKNRKITAMDLSSTGLGKTYCTIALCKQLDMVPIIICNLTMISYWNNVCKIFEIEPSLIINYEKIKGKKFENNYVSYDENTKKYIWKFDNFINNIVIFDEAHNCKNINSLNGKLLMSLKNISNVLLLTATLCDKPTDFVVFGYMLNFYNTIKQSKGWIDNIVREDKKKFTKENSLEKYIFPQHGSKMEIKDLGTTTPDNIISVECYTLKDKYIQIINNKYNQLIDKKNETGNLNITDIVEIRQLIEKYKCEPIINEINKYLEYGKSVVVFINYLASLDILKKYYNKINYSVVVGGQTNEQRNNNINLFQTNQNKLIFMTMQTGSQSISLHDIIGNNPRVSIISPSYSSIDLIQALGRIHRSGMKSIALQKIVLCDNTYEMKIRNVLQKKINFLDKLTDDDLFSL
jgi:superfamily II DNA or RNA helicase